MMSHKLQVGTTQVGCTALADAATNMHGSERSIQKLSKSINLRDRRSNASAIIQVL